MIFVDLASLQQTEASGGTPTQYYIIVNIILLTILLLILFSPIENNKQDLN